MSASFARLFIPQTATADPGADPKTVDAAHYLRLGGYAGEPADWLGYVFGGPASAGSSGGSSGSSGSTSGGSSAGSSGGSAPAFSLAGAALRTSGAVRVTSAGDATTYVGASRNVVGKGSGSSRQLLVLGDVAVEASSVVFDAKAGATFSDKPKSEGAQNIKISNSSDLKVKSDESVTVKADKKLSKTFTGAYQQVNENGEAKLTLGSSLSMSPIMLFAFALSETTYEASRFRYRTTQINTKGLMVKVMMSKIEYKAFTMKGGNVLSHLALTATGGMLGLFAAGTLANRDAGESTDMNTMIASNATTAQKVFGTALGLHANKIIS